MRVTGTRLDVVYEARFAPPALSIAINPGAVLTSLFESVNSRYGVALRDVTATPSQRASDVRVRLTLFNGRATIEVDADKMGAQFENARFSGDVATIKECIELALAGIAKALPSNRLSDHTLRVLMWLELKEEPKNARAFLSSLSNAHAANVVPRIPNGEGVLCTPGVRFELAHEEHRWVYTYELTRAYRSDTELFQSVTLGCLDRSPVATMDDRVALLEKLLGATWQELGVVTSDGAQLT